MATDWSKPLTLEDLREPEEQLAPRMTRVALPNSEVLTARDRRALELQERTRIARERLKRRLDSSWDPNKPPR